MTSKTTTIVGGDRAKTVKTQDTASLWKELHLRALSFVPEDHLGGGSKPSDASWILKWSRKIPRFTKGCACNEHWQKWYGQNLPNYTSADAYFEWTVRAHNAVNERLNKPTFTVQQAKDYYSTLT